MRGGAPPRVPVCSTLFRWCKQFLIVKDIFGSWFSTCYPSILLLSWMPYFWVAFCLGSNSLHHRFASVCKQFAGPYSVLHCLWILAVITPSTWKAFCFYVLLLSSSPTLPFFMPSYNASLFVTQVHMAFSPFGSHQSPGSERPVLAVGSLPCSLFHSLHSLAESYSIHCVALWLFEYLSISAVKSCLGSSTSV